MNLDHIGKYRVVGTIGKGAMGEVYKAKDPLLNRYVAIKTIAPALAGDDDFRRRFQREAQSAAQLNHPAIVTVFDFGEENGLAYMAMEYLEGRDLKDVIRSRELRLADKLSVMDQLSDGLAFAHARGFVHRDLKPGNVKVQAGGQVKILDFGLARPGGSDLTRTGTVMGTPHYMSPEQVRGEKADARSDVFSLGAVFYELLCNHRPFDADSVHGVLFQILEHEPEPIRKWAPEVPPVLVAVVERALAKDPFHRWADAGEMAKGLAGARQSIAGETAFVAPRAERTLLPGADATVVDPGPAATVRGATVLALAEAPARHGPPARTVRPDPTVGGGPPTHVPARGGLGRPLLLAGAGAAALAAAVGGFLWLRGGAASPTPAGGGTGQGLEEVYAASQVELARADLTNRDYAAAARRAQEVLDLAPTNPGARDVLDRAHQAQREIEEAVATARGALGRGEPDAASSALGRVMALDPRHPAIAEMSAALKRHLRPQAEDGRRQAAGARRAAEAAQAGTRAGFAQGRKLAAEADALLGRQDYAAAAQRYMESRDAFDRAKREADEARAAAVRPSPSAYPVAAVAATTPVPSAPPMPQPAVSPTVVPMQAAPVAPVAPSTLLPTPPTTRPAGPDAEADRAEVRRVVAEYARAMETRDLALYRTLMPGLPAEDEKRLREAFKTYKPQRVSLTIDSLQLEGDRATVRTTRQDVIDGRPTKAVSQAFHLARAGATWQIQSIGR
jgi:serine/threonine-protein kinase